MILQAFAGGGTPLVFIGNWSSSQYGRELKAKMTNNPSLTLLDPIYDLGILKSIRANAALYVHGHSAGGTNPSLVEIMHFAAPIFAYDCAYNRCTTELAAIFFRTAEELRDKVATLGHESAIRLGREARQIALRRYTWDTVAGAYFALIQKGRYRACSAT